jgi:hypothetical protein
MNEENKDLDIATEKQKKYAEYLISQVQDPNQRAIYFSELKELKTKQELSDFITRLQGKPQQQPQPQPQLKPPEQQTIKLQAVENFTKLKQELKEIAKKYNLKIVFFRVTETDNGTSISIRFFKEVE